MEDQVLRTCHVHSLEAILEKVLIFGVHKIFGVEAGDKAKNIGLVVLLGNFAVSSINFNLVWLSRFFFAKTLSHGT